MSEKTYIVSVSVLGADCRQITGIGSWRGCSSEAAAIRKSLRQKFTAMGPGDWQSDDYLVEISEHKPGSAIPKLKWDIKQLREARLRHKRSKP